MGVSDGNDVYCPTHLEMAAGFVLHILEVVYGIFPGWLHGLSERCCAGSAQHRWQHLHICCGAVSAVLQIVVVKDVWFVKKGNGVVYASVYASVCVHTCACVREPG